VTVLLTGAAGFIGTEVAHRLLLDTAHDLVALVRGRDDEDARRRLGRAWWGRPELVLEIGRRVEVVRGDVSLPRLGLSREVYERLASQITHLIHAAADLRLDASFEDRSRTNVDGVRHALDLARDAARDHPFARFAHVSTAYVAGLRRGEIAEEDLDGACGFANPYERTKYEGERLVREAAAVLPVSVFRPGMVVGNSRTGEARTYNTLYVPLRLYLTGKIHLAPVRSSLRVNLVPVDYVADAIARLALDPRAAGLTFHLVLPHERLPTARELLDATRAWAKERLGVDLPRPLFLPVPLPTGRSGRGRGSRATLRLLAPYLRGDQVFLRENADRLLGPCPLDWREFLPRLLADAARRGFLHRSGRTVHEQVLFRLGGKSRPVRLYDLVEGKVIRRGARDVALEMRRAAAALRSLGVRTGDRVALVGPNGTRYLALDVAIGLAGAVSVPLYCTSPIGEIDAILNDSGARILLVGSPAILERAGELAAPVKLISFARSPLPPSLAGRATTWEGFLALGAGKEAAGEALVSLGDRATLRYTSGTTGRPRGVAFRHDQLVQMAETLVSLFPWRARTSRIAYLSFLPMNHVVEGILITYAPHHAPAPLDLFFLEDFRGLPQALRRVRPTFFFSVPRFYEKVWEGARRNALLRRYLALQEGKVKEALRRLVRRAVLRRAGLDRAVQLLVGSAPASDDLLLGLHSLGVEVHNAYGLTEAPLVTMNRLGENRLGTVGEPLPETEVRIAPDGEVLVRGPQVAAGSAGEDGFLATGDLGRLEEGYLVLAGRKKELVVTAYGKNVSPARVEGVLREVPGVSQAMLVGDGRPYCVALLWVEGGWSLERGWGIDRGIEAASARLSHPEQPKRWAVLSDDLSIEKGDLTANLKLRRAEVLRRRADVVAFLYGEGEPPAGVLHLGRAKEGR
jgi:long-chain acyl-CoA synthetase